MPEPQRLLIINQAGPAGRDAGIREPPAGQLSFTQVTGTGRDIAEHDLRGLRPVAG
jgi:hypothetical protein